MAPRSDSSAARLWGGVRRSPWVGSSRREGAFEEDLGLAMVPQRSFARPVVSQRTAAKVLWKNPWKLGRTEPPPVEKAVGERLPLGKRRERSPLGP
jgi:hypothetical protein